MIGSLIFGGYNTANSGCYIVDRKQKETARREYDVVDIPGTNGSILYDRQRYSNVEMEYGFVVPSNAKTAVAALMNGLMSKIGWNRLSDSFNSDVFYTAYFDHFVQLEYSSDGKQAKGRFVFVRRAERFLTSGEAPVTIASSQTLLNPTLMVSKPIIRVTGTGSFSVGGSSVSISTNPNYIDIDSERQDCYYGSTNCNRYVSLSRFPVLSPGNNTVSKGSVTTLVVTPRWWQL